MEEDKQKDVSKIEMYEWQCCTCGCTMWMPKFFNDSLRRTHQTFYCVCGHSNHYAKKTDTEELEGKLVNEYSKNAQLEKEIEKLRTKILNHRSLFSKLFKRKTKQQV
jgi:hypothetical protein